jgi:hypothetical protein
MDDPETKDVDKDEDESGEQVDKDDAAGQTDDTDDTADLPEDPAALRTMALEQRRQNRKLNQDLRKSNRQVEREKERAGQYKDSSEYWAGEAERRGSHASQASNGGGSRSDAREEAPDDDVEAVLKTLDVGEFITDQPEEGARKLFETLTNKFGFMRKTDAMRLARDMIAEERNAGSKYREIAGRYPSLKDKDSELSKETAHQLDLVIKEHPSLDDPTRMEIAAARATAIVGNPRASSNGNHIPEDKSRLRAAQGGPRGKGDSRPATGQVTNEMRALNKKMGGELDEKALARVAQRVKDSNRQNARQ